MRDFFLVVFSILFCLLTYISMTSLWEHNVAKPAKFRFLPQKWIQKNTLGCVSAAQSHTSFFLMLPLSSCLRFRAKGAIEAIKAPPYKLWSFIAQHMGLKDLSVLFDLSSGILGQKSPKFDFQSKNLYCAPKSEVTLTYISNIGRTILIWNFIKFNFIISQQVC